MKFLGLLLLLFGQLAVAAGPSHAFETVLYYIAYRLEWKMYGQSQRLLYPVKSPLLEGDLKPFPQNVGPDGNMLPFPDFVCRYMNRDDKTGAKCNVELDLDNPERTGELLLKEGNNGAAKIPDMRGVPKDKMREIIEENDAEITDDLKYYNSFTEDLAQTFNAAAKKYGTSTSSEVYKELAAVEPLVDRILKVRSQDMQKKRNIRQTFVQAFFQDGGAFDGYKGSIDPADMLKNAKLWQAVKLKLGMEKLPDDDPKIMKGLKDWVDGIGKTYTVKPKPLFGVYSYGHIYALKGWEGMKQNLQCQLKSKK
ncbi:hypothetical protein K4K52_008984 [Colletotrichum sp. SAR 10_76]|nr:hypothetical protein K4K52_008984 [Colletotrichum sp. SAR 10_76]